MIPIQFAHSILNYSYNAGDNVGVPLVPPSSNTGRTFNSVHVRIEDDEEPYETTRAIDSDDDQPIPPLSEEDIELIRRFCFDRDPLVPIFNDL